MVGWDIARADPEELEDLLQRYRPKLIYTNPTFHNPTGRTLPVETRKALLSLAARYRLPVLEDEPYRELSFRHPPPPTLLELDEHGLVIHLGTSSKTLAAGLRLGWLIAPEAVVDQLTLVRQRSDLFGPGAIQLVVAELLARGIYDVHIRTLRAAAAGVVIVSGEAFYPDNAGWHEFRLCFARNPLAAIAAGIEQLAGVLNDQGEIAPRSRDTHPLM